MSATAHNLKPGQPVCHVSQPEGSEAFGLVEFADEHGANVVEWDGSIAYFEAEDIRPHPTEAKPFKAHPDVWLPEDRVREFVREAEAEGVDLVDLSRFTGGYTSPAELSVSDLRDVLAELAAARAALASIEGKSA